MARPLLAGMSLTIRPGERIACLGRNGAGKSTSSSCCRANWRPPPACAAKARAWPWAALAQYALERLRPEVAAPAYPCASTPKPARELRDYLGS